MNNFILFTLILFTANLRAQSIWNDTISLGYPRARITDMIVDNDTIIVYGTGFNNAIEYKQGLIIAKLDSSGNVLQNKILLDSLGDKLAVDESWGKIIKTKDGGYAATAAPFSRNSSLLIKWSQNLDIEFIKEYSDSVNLSNFNYKPIEVSGGYFLYGSIQLPDLISVGIIKYVDKAGNVIWERQFPYAPHGTRVMDMAQIKDSIFVFVTTETLTPFSQFTVQSGRSGIYYINIEGEIISSWKSEAEPEIGYLRKVIPVGENDVITYGVEPQDVINGTIRIVQPTLARYTSSFQTEWINHFGLAHPLDWLLTLRDFIQTSDNNYLGVGRTIDGHGWVYKFSPEGDSIWGRNFPTPFPDYYPYGGRLYGAGLLSSGNIVAGGIAENGQTEFCWIIKLTNDGCMDTLFCQTSSMIEITEIATGKTLNVFPNPANESLTITYEKEIIEGHLRLSDMYGRIAGEATFTGNMTTVAVGHFAPGVYSLEIYSGNTFVQRTKVVISH